MTAETRSWRRKPASAIAVDVVIPVFNEAHVLERCVRQVHDYFSAQIPYGWQIVIAENGSSDDTAAVGKRICDELPHVDMVIVDRPGRGRALRSAWSQGQADIVCYTDVDLSTGLEAFPRLFRALIDEGYDLAVGSRLLRNSRTTRGVKRTLISRAYNLLLKLTLGVRFSDAQTGFKGLTRVVVDRVLPLVKDEAWFLDTELLVLSEKSGFRVADIPITWVDDEDSRVKIFETAWKDLEGIWRLRRTLRAGSDWVAVSTGAKPSGR